MTLTILFLLDILLITFYIFIFYIYEKIKEKISGKKH